MLESGGSSGGALAALHRPGGGLPGRAGRAGRIVPKPRISRGFFRVSEGTRTPDRRDHNPKRLLRGVRSRARSRRYAAVRQIAPLWVRRVSVSPVAPALPPSLVKEPHARSSAAGVLSGSVSYIGSRAPPPGGRASARCGSQGHHPAPELVEPFAERLVTSRTVRRGAAMPESRRGGRLTPAEVAGTCLPGLHRRSFADAG